MKKKDLLVLLNQVCDDFESELKSGNTNIEVGKAVESATRTCDSQEFLDALLPELISLKIAYSDDQHEEADSLRSKFPEHASIIANALADPSLQGTFRSEKSETRQSGTRSALPAAMVHLGDDARFENLEHYASGGLGDVYSGFDRTVRRQVAVKLLKPTLVTVPEAKGRFLNEAEITGGLEHPGIVPIYDSGITPDGQPYYAMRLLKGETLKGAIDQLHFKQTATAFSEKLRALIRRLIDVCDVISYAHDQGVIHRDLKPANVLLGEYGESVVIDWGLARRESVDGSTESDPASAIPDEISFGREEDSRHTKAGSLLGTFGYMSPEQASGDLAKVNELSDVYSLGAVLFTILTGGSPQLSTENIDEQIDAACSANYPTARERNSEVPLPLDAICSRAMSRTPADRYSSASMFGNDMENWLSDLPIEARPDNFFDRAMRFVRKHRRWSVAAVLTLFAVSAGSIIAAATLNSQSNRLAASNLRANESLQDSIAAIKDFFQQVERSDAFQDTPATIELRRQLLSNGSEYLTRFLNKNRDNPELQLEVGKGLLQLSRFHGRLGENEAQRDRSLEAMDVLGELYQVSDTPDHEVAAYFATALYNFARKTARLEGFEAARPYFEQAITVSQPLPAAAIEAPLIHPPELAQVHYSSRIQLSQERFNSGDPATAILNADKTLELLRQYAAHFADDAAVQQRASTEHNLVGVMHARNGDAVEAAKRYRIAIDLANIAIELDPENQRNKRRLAGASGNLIIALQDLGDYDQDEVRKLQRQVNTIFQTSAELHPGNLRFQLNYIRAISNSGSVFGQMNVDEGLPYLLQSQELVDEATEDFTWEKDPENWMPFALIKSSSLATFAGLYAEKGEHEKQLEYMKRYVAQEKLIWERSPNNTTFRITGTCNILSAEAAKLIEQGQADAAFEVVKLILETEAAETKKMDDESLAFGLADRLNQLVDSKNEPDFISEDWPDDLQQAYTDAFRVVETKAAKFQKNNQFKVPSKIDETKLLISSSGKENLLP
jgi:serine/threonine protein kinase